MPLYYKKGRQMCVKMKRKLAVITRAKRRILYSKWKEVMEDKCWPCNSEKHMHLSISGTKLGVLIWSKNGQILIPILIVETWISTCLFWLNC